MTTTFICEDCEIEKEGYIKTEASSGIELHKMNHTLKRLEEMLTEYLKSIGVYRD